MLHYSSDYNYTRVFERILVQNKRKIGGGFFYKPALTGDFRSFIKDLRIEYVQDRLIRFYWLSFDKPINAFVLFNYYIKRKCSDVFDKYNVNFCYLFGSYSKWKAKPTSDVDLLISTDATGLKFYGLVEDIRTALHKKVDVLDINQLKDYFELTQEILKDGVKIYG